jgi:hypothetical protein
LFKRHQSHFSDKAGKDAQESGIQYLYWGLTGARFARSQKTRHADDTDMPLQPEGAASAEYNLTPSDPLPQPPPDDIPADHDSTPWQTIARLTAERDAARYERELETDYREALLRDLDVLSRQLKETQRRVAELEQSDRAPDIPSQAATERERRLENELEEARSRIAQLEGIAALAPPASLTPGQEGMMDAFMQFVGLQGRHDE